ncbi:hypothetical protein FDB28_01450 [Clostridium botulinum]|nr:hypothetical protein [Clostridium botulinum]NFS95626.1 hypothetical protein [Clostridium botulinum]
MNEKIKILKNSIEYICYLKNKSFEIIECLHNEEEIKAFSLIADISGELGVLFETLEYIKEFKDIKIYIEAANEKLKEIVEAIENEDTILIADLFEYELISILDDIKKVIGKMII